LSLKGVGSFDIAETSVALRPEEKDWPEIEAIDPNAVMCKNIDIEGLSPRALLAILKLQGRGCAVHRGCWLGGLVVSRGGQTRDK
jgi:hypothetical protein